MDLILYMDYIWILILYMDIYMIHRYSRMLLKGSTCYYFWTVSAEGKTHRLLIYLLQENNYTISMQKPRRDIIQMKQGRSLQVNVICI